MSAESKREETVFDEARQIQDRAARRAYLDQACAGDATLRANVEDLLSAESEADQFFADTLPAFQPAAEDLRAATRIVTTADEQIGSLIGHYKLVEKLGEGGYGAVYRAEQQQPVRRQVALKIIKLGMDTRAVIARFEAERQALAVMDHPNIARVFDAGATEKGRPYFVMELVQGVKITDYCDQHQLDLRQRLVLFTQICLAIQHAHQKGVVHRDIKPSNILVILQDGGPVPKVIDFGIAKATETPLASGTPVTTSGLFLGTPAYMSPEQAQMTGVDIDTRSDIYSLGVLLYELLTGKTPFDSKALMKAGLDEMRRILREVEPPRPSAKVGALPDGELATTAGSRQTEPSRLAPLLQRDLDWIAMKALEKDRARRYQAANDLALDLQRFLNDEPVQARPPSKLYRFQKLVRRNRVVFASAAIVVVALVVSVLGLTTLYLQQRAARKRAEEAEAKEVRVSAAETELRHQAEAREMVTTAAVLVNQENFEEADRLTANASSLATNLESARVLRALGDWHALHNRWPQAAQRFEVLLQLDQLDTPDVATADYLRCATALLKSGDQPGYQQLRQSALLRFGDISNPLAAEQMLEGSLLRPADGDVLASLGKLAEVAAQQVPEGLGTPFGGSLRRRDFSIKSNPTDPVAPVDPDPPALVGAFSFNGGSIGLEFSKPVALAGATNPAHYSVPGATVTNVALRPDGQSAVLWLDASLTNSFSVAASNIADTTGNLLRPGSPATNAVLNLRVKDFGTGQPWETRCAGNTMTVVAGGTGLSSPSDSFVYAFLVVTNDFDYRLRIESVQNPAGGDGAMTGLMVRGLGNDPATRQITIGVSAAHTLQLVVRAGLGAPSQLFSPNPLPSALPANVWVRLSRAGTVFHAYCSTNGAEWVQVYQFDGAYDPEGPLANPICLGIATCARSPAATTTAVVSDFSPTPEVPVGIMASLALMEYRCGDFNMATEWGRRCLASPEYNAARTATVRCLLALADWRLDRRSEAHAEFVQAQTPVGWKFKSGLEPGNASQGRWFDWVFADILLQEASALLGESAEVDFRSFDLK